MKKKYQIIILGICLVYAGGLVYAQAPCTIDHTLTTDPTAPSNKKFPLKKNFFEWRATEQDQSYDVYHPTYPSLNSIISPYFYTRSVLVKTTGWADYVFHDSYQLPNLSDVETYIKLNKHLPDIPSEKEVNQNGVDLVEVQKSVLKKVEELTLYVIALKKENINLHNRIQDLESKQP